MVGMETRHLWSLGSLCILLLTDKVSGLIAWRTLTHRWDERQEHNVDVEHPAVVKTLCFVFVIIFVKGVLPKCVVNYLKTKDVTYYD